MKTKILVRALGAVLALSAGAAMMPAKAATINQTLCVGTVNRTMSDGATVTFWGFGSGGMMCTGAFPGPEITIGTGDTLNLTLNVGMMTPQEAAPYNGHTVHLHGADVPTSEDGVPETNSNRVNGDTYTWVTKAEEAGSYMYHCHVHTVKHLEMGMYGALIVRPRDAAGNFMNRLTANAATAYDYVQTYLLSSVDPAYHTATGDSTVFADYNPKYFLIGGAEGKTTSAPARTLATAVNKKVALRLIGLHSTNATFSIKDGSGNAKSFTVYVEDGRQLPTALMTSSLDISPGKRYDIVFTTPTTAGTWYPQVAYKNLRDGAVYTNGTVYGRVTF